LCLACDFRLGTPQADMFMPATRLGLHFYAGGMTRYVTRLGVDQAKRLFLTADRIGVEEMLRIGVLTELVVADQLDSRLQALAGHLADTPRQSLLGVKRHSSLIARGQIGVRQIQQAVLRSERARDIAEGERAWTEKRKPRFSGH